MICIAMSSGLPRLGDIKAQRSDPIVFSGVCLDQHAELLIMSLEAAGMMVDEVGSSGGGGHH